MLLTFLMCVIRISWGMQGSEPRELGRETEGPVCETETASNACGSVSGSHAGRHSAGSVSLLLLFHHGSLLNRKLKPRLE